jgi:4a-hydroxytetrahydrobiopterin dehydratase
MPGPEVVIYSRKPCHLCDVAKEAIAAIAAEGIELTVRDVNIDADPDLKRRFGNDVPVIFIGGTEAMRHRVDPARFRALVASSPGGGSVSELASLQCIPCRGGVPPMQEPDITRYKNRLGGGWEVVNEHHLRKEFGFRDFAEALAFTNRVGAIAEKEGHHPDIELSWGKVVVTIWTHKIDGLTESDFVLAAKIDKPG